MKETIAEQQNLTFIDRILYCIKEALPQGVKTAIWLLKITIPVSFGVLLLDYFGGLEFIAQYTTPLFKFIGLPGVAAIVIITSVFTNIYSVVAVLTALALPVRDGTIIAVMCLISHGFIIETAVLKKTGSSSIRMILLRLMSSFIVGWVLNKMMPGNASIGELININKNLIFHEVLVDWFYLISKTIVKILVLVNLLLILQKILEEFKLIKLLERPLKPIMKFFGLPEQTTFSLIVANTLGLAYGSAVMINQVKEGKMMKKQADLLNHHISLSHSQLEDPLLFLTLGYSLPWLILPRVVIGIIAVWIRKIEIRIKQN